MWYTSNMFQVICINNLAWEGHPYPLELHSIYEARYVGEGKNQRIRIGNQNYFINRFIVILQPNNNLFELISEDS